MDRIEELLEVEGIKRAGFVKSLLESYNMPNGYIHNLYKLKLEVLLEISRIVEFEPMKLIKTDKPSK